MRRFTFLNVQKIGKRPQSKKTAIKGVYKAAFKRVLRGVPPMPVEITSLCVGDIVAIKYRLARYSTRGVCFVEPWLMGRIVNGGDGGWPIARLDDGQVTELRPFMTWRLVARGELDCSGDIAA